MNRVVLSVLASSLLTSVASAEPIRLYPRTESPPAESASARTEPAYPIRQAAAERPRLGGGLIEAIFSGGHGRGDSQYYRGPASYPPGYEQDYRSSLQPRSYDGDYGQRQVDPRFNKQVVAYSGSEPPGTIVIDTRQYFLYLVQGNGTALRYGVGVGRPGFTWAGVKHVSAKREWPDWRPPSEMLRRRPDLPSYMAGGPENPLGARALYLGSSLYRIHGSNEPWTIGTQVSSGCIRMRNEDVIDLYQRVGVGTKVVVI
jgi:lipoprotein-anchoring transpeptidase ErfK/SrfK